MHEQGKSVSKRHIKSQARVISGERFNPDWAWLNLFLKTHNIEGMTAKPGCRASKPAIKHEKKEADENPSIQN